MSAVTILTACPPTYHHRYHPNIDDDDNSGSYHLHDKDNSQTTTTTMTPLPPTQQRWQQWWPHHYNHHHTLKTTLINCTGTSSIIGVVATVINWFTALSTCVWANDVECWQQQQQLCGWWQFYLSNYIIYLVWLRLMYLVIHQLHKMFDLPYTEASTFHSTTSM